MCSFRWFKHLSEAAEAYNKREGKSKRSEPTPDTEEETVQELPTQREQAERAESVGGSDTVSCGETENNVPSSSDSNQRNSEVLEDDKDKRLSGENEQQHVAQSTSSGMPKILICLKIDAENARIIESNFNKNKFLIKYISSIPFINLKKNKIKFDFIKLFEVLERNNA